MTTVTLQSSSSEEARKDEDNSNNTNTHTTCSIPNGEVKLSIESDKNGVNNTTVLKTSLKNNNMCNNTDIKRKVSFKDIHIREYFIELGDNPSCTRGPPLTIGWDFDDVGSVQLEEFEEYRPPRRVGGQMHIPFDARQEMLEQIGYSPLDIRTAVQECNVARYNRMKTAKSKSDKVDAAVESANRKLKRLFTRKGRD